LTGPLPAWAWQFEGGQSAGQPAMGLSCPITTDWAFAGSTGAGVKVAVVDSGIEDGHPLIGAVQGGVAIEPDGPTNVRIVEGPHEDLFGHGTACAGIIRSLAPDCELYSVRVLGAGLTGRGTVFAAGVQWAIDNGMDVVNISMSTRRPAMFSTFHRIADRAYFAGTVLVSAINNVPVPSYPSEFASVISVASAPGEGPYALTYNPHPPVEFGAPGVSIELAWLGGSTTRATGNSFAAPRVAGLVTLLKSKHPNLTPFEVKTVLRAVATNVG
jgi:subtilisin